MPAKRKQQTPTKMKLKKNDRVVVIAGRDKDKTGKILVVNRKNNTLVVEGVNIVSKHMKPGRESQTGGIIKKEASIHASNVMYLHKGEPTRIGYKVEEIEDENGRKKRIKTRIAKSTGETIDG